MNTVWFSKYKNREKKDKECPRVDGTKEMIVMKMNGIPTSVYGSFRRRAEQTTMDFVALHWLVEELVEAYAYECLASRSFVCLCRMFRLEAKPEEGLLYLLGSGRQSDARRGIIERPGSPAAALEWSNEQFLPSMPSAVFPAEL